MLNLNRLIRQNPICAILRHVDPDRILRYARAVYDGGIRMFEVALNSEDAYKQIVSLRETFGDTAYIGAGTVIGRERCEKALKAGAQFFLTPSASVETLEFCGEHDMPLLPGVMTPTDVAVCLSYGYSTLKLFPAGDLPLSYIRSLKGPFDGTDYVAVGGVGPGTLRQFFDAGFIGVGMGSNLAPEGALMSDRYEDITAYVRSMMDLVHENPGRKRK